MKILLISAFLPFPQSLDGRQAVFYCVEELSKNHDFSLLSFVDSEHELQHLPKIKRCFSSIKIIRRYKIEGPLYPLTPAYFASYFSSEMWKEIKKMTSEKYYDIILVAYPGMMQYIEAILEGHTIFELHELPSLRLKRLLRAENRFFRKGSLFFQWLKMIRYEDNRLPKFDKILAITDVEKNMLKKRMPRLDVSVLPSRVDTTYLDPAFFNDIKPLKNSLVFVGAMGRIENADAVTYFCSDILPLIKKKVPDVKLNIVGARPTSKIQKLDERDDVMITGFVEDVRPYIAQSQVYIVPIRLGGGIRYKVLEAMAMGKTIVSTSIGCEGIDVTNGENVILANSSREFAMGVVELLSNAEKRKYLGENARKLIEEKYSKEIVARKLNRIFEEVVNP